MDRSSFFSQERSKGWMRALAEVFIRTLGRMALGMGMR